MKTIEERKSTIKSSIQPLNVIYQWVKSDEITYNQFTKLLEFIEENNRKEKSYDDLV